jgi:hypothetical protein
MTMRTLLIATALAAVSAPPIAAQPGLARVGAGVTYESYFFSAAEDVSLDRLSLLTVPLGARIAFTRSIDLEVAGAWAVATAERPDGTSSDVSGPTDTELRLTATFGRGAVALTGIALLPTGSEALTLEEADIAGLIAADVLPFRITNWGTGGGFGASTSFAQGFGEYAAGISVGYVVAREFEPISDDDFTYRPGNQLHVRAAIDRTFGSAGKAALVLTMQRYADDELDGANLFSTGDRYQALGSYAFAAGGRGNGIVYAGYLHRGEGEFDEGADVVPAQGLAFGGVGLELPAGRALLQPSVDLRLLRQEDGTGQGYTAGVGGSAEVPAGTITFIPTVRGRFGNVMLRDDAESGFTGVEVGLALRFGSPDR